MNILTLSYKASPLAMAEARSLSQDLGLVFVVRKKESLKKLQEAYQADFILVYTGHGPYVYFGPGQEHSFHLSMAQLRILNLQRGQGDHLLEAVGQDVKSVLDCTLGLGADAIVLSYALGPQAQVEGLEGSLPLWFVTSQGLSSFVHEDPQVTEALRRIKTRYGDSFSYLSFCQDKSWDVVYFDPMFEVPVEESPQFKPLRGHLVEAPFSQAVLEEAKRVARKRVVVKERKGAHLFENLPPDRLLGGKYSRLAYGVYDVD